MLNTFCVAMALFCLPRGDLFRLSPRSQTDLVAELAAARDTASALDDAMLSSIAESGESRYSINIGSTNLLLLAGILIMKDSMTTAGSRKQALSPGTSHAG